MSEIIEWSNNNSGWVTILVFLAGILLSSAVWMFRSPQSRPALKLEVLKEATLCSSFNAGTNSDRAILHRTAFLVYLKVTNVGRVPVQIGDIHLGYRSSEAITPEAFRWLVNEITMLEDYTLPIGDKIKIFPFLKQSNALFESSVRTYLMPGEYVNGLVYFEQEDSIGLDYPYMDADFHVATRIRVHDTLGSFWEMDASVVKVMIDAIRKLNPTFGLSRDHVARRT